MDKLYECEIETIAYVLAKWLKYSSASNFSHQRFDELADIVLGKVNIQFEFIVLVNVGSQNEKCKLLWSSMKVMRYQTTHTHTHAILTLDAKPKSIGWGVCLLCIQSTDQSWPNAVQRTKHVQASISYIRLLCSIGSETLARNMQMKHDSVN